MATQKDRLQDARSLNLDGCKRLANAIIITAIEDYKRGRINMREFARFINSGYFQVLSRGCVAPEKILKEVIQECHENKRQFLL